MTSYANTPDKQTSVNASKNDSMVIKIKADTNKNNIAKKARQIMMNPNADKLCMVIPRLYKWLILLY